MAFLSSLVQLEVFQEVSISFLLVGQTGERFFFYHILPEVDGFFMVSPLTFSQMKSEINLFIYFVVLKSTSKFGYLSGNETDQCFSVIATELKKEDILTLETLKKKIEDSPLNPKPVCRDLQYIYNWKSGGSCTDESY